MIALEDYYHFSASEVEYIETLKAASGDHPYRLTVNLRSGKSCSVCYATQKGRDEARNRIVREIERETRCDAERVLNALYLVKRTTELIDKRQMKIWRQLKALLGVRVEEDADA